LILTKLDVLDSFEELKICTGYMHDGEPLDHFPASLKVLQECVPVYETLPGWQTPTTEARRMSDLPEAARNYIARLEEVCEVPISLISVSPSREGYIARDNSLLNYQFDAPGDKESVDERLN
jgi:adenylosuccinate synthase